MSRSLNNFCESLVNGSNPRYIGSQPTLSEQVAWQLKKEEETRQALYKESAFMDEKRRSKSSSTYTPAYTPVYTPAYTPVYTPAYTPIYTPAYTPTYSTPTYSVPTYSVPTYSTKTDSSYPSFNCTNYGRVI